MIAKLPRRFMSSLPPYAEPFRIVLLGAPGVGKGTFGKKISKDSKMPIFSTGDYLRKLVARPDIQEHPDLLAIKKTIESGQFVSDSQVMQAVKAFVEEKAEQNSNQPQFGILFDGVPRNLNQARLLDEIVNVNVAVNFEINEDVLIQKLMGRRVCKQCGSTWNVCHIDQDGYFMKPLLPSLYRGVYEGLIREKSPKEVQEELDKLVVSCHKEGQLERRADDNEEVIRRRMEKYKEETEPLLEYYEKQGKLISFEPKRGVDDYEKIVEGVSKKIGERLFETMTGAPAPKI